MKRLVLSVAVVLNFVVLSAGAANLEEIVSCAETPVRADGTGYAVSLEQDSNTKFLVATVRQQPMNAP